MDIPNENNGLCPENEAQRQQRLLEQINEEEAMEQELLDAEEARKVADYDSLYADYVEGPQPGEIDVPWDADDYLYGEPGVCMKPFVPCEEPDDPDEDYCPDYYDEELHLEPGRYLFRDAHISLDTDADEPFHECEVYIDIEERQVDSLTDLLFVIASHLDELTSDPKMNYLTELYYSPRYKQIDLVFEARELNGNKPVYPYDSYTGMLPLFEPSE